MKFQRLMPVEQFADNTAVLFNLLPVKAVDKRLIDGGPEGGKQDMQFFRPHVRPADSPPLSPALIHLLTDEALLFRMVHM